MNNFWTIAQASADQPSSGISSTPAGEQQTSTMTTAQDPNAVQGRRQTPQSPIPSWLLIGLMFVVMYLIFFRAPQKQKQQRKKMVQSLQKNDKVQTIGGIIGTIVDVKEDEITLKVDESNNTKIKVSPNAIGKNISKDKD